MSRRPKKTLYIVENESKYIGNACSIICRSSWERKCCKYFDQNENIISWSSEEVIIKYVCGTDNKIHNYHVDFLIQLKNKKRILIEVKPEAETMPPKRKTKRALHTWVKNQSKWKAAKIWCEKRDIDFQIWTEHTLTALGMVLFKPKAKLKRSRMKKLKALPRPKRRE